MPSASASAGSVRVDMRAFDISSGEVLAHPPAATILSVDDEAEVGDLLARIFRPTGSRVDWCGTCAEATQRLAAGLPDLLILDLGLPDADGLNLCRELKQRPRTNAIPVIVITGRTDEATRLAALEAGADHVMTKPIHRGELVARVGALLHARAISRALEEQRTDLKLRRDWVRYLAHDLRSALSIPLLCAEQLDQLHLDRLDPAAGEALTDLLHGLRQAARLVNDLLDTERLRYGHLRPRPAFLDLVERARAAVGDLRPVLAFNGVEAVLAGRSSLLVECDGDLIYRVFFNILCNATRYATRRTSILIDLASEGDQAVVSISNQGPSIPPEARERIFEPFIRLDGTPGAGSGLGLAYAARAVQAHGGTIWVDEPPGGGARFWVRLPLRTRVSP